MTAQRGMTASTATAVPIADRAGPSVATPKNRLRLRSATMGSISVNMAGVLRVVSKVRIVETAPCNQVSKSATTERTTVATTNARQAASLARAAETAPFN